MSCGSSRNEGPHPPGPPLPLPRAHPPRARGELILGVWGRPSTGAGVLGGAGEGTGVRTLLLLALVVVSCSRTPADRSSLEPISLTPGAVYPRSLSGGQTRRFGFDSPAGRFLHLTVEQQGIDVIVLLRDPSGHLIFEVDNPIGASGTETVVAVTPAAGKYTLEIEPFKEEGKGSFVLAVRKVRTATARDRREAAGTTALFRAERRRLAGDFERAVPAYREALPHLDALHRKEEAAEAYWHLGDSLIETGALTAAAESLEVTAARFHDLRDPVSEARALNRLGTCRRFLGDPRRALDAHERSLLQYRAAGSVSGEAAALNNLSLVLENSGRLQEAIEKYEEALGLWRKLGKKQAEAVTLQNLGRLYIIIGHDAEGMDYHQQALKLVQNGKPSERVPVLIEIGWANYLMGRPEVALAFYDEALELVKTYRDRIAEAGAWDRRGTALRAMRRFGEAGASFSRALEISRAAGNPVNQAHTLANLGDLDLQLDPDSGAVARGRKRLQKAAEMFEAAGDPNGELAARVGVSRAARRQGDLGTAREEAEAAVRLVEELRSGLLGSRSRGQFLATRYDAFEELVALHMDLSRREPGRGHAQEALEVAERARARGLLEDMGHLESANQVVGVGGGSLSRKAREGRGGGLGREGAPLARGGSARSVRGSGRGDGGEGRALQAEIQAMDARRESLALDDPKDPRLRDLDAQLRQRALALDRLAAVHREPSPGFHPLRASQIQSLADANTLLVFYLLAEPESFAWTVDRNAIEAHVLPGRKRIEKLARRLVGALSQSRGVAAQGTIDSASRELSEALLSPLGQRLKGHRRLAILADGALHLIPFAALPKPRRRSPLSRGGEMGRRERGARGVRAQAVPSSPITRS